MAAASTASPAILFLSARSARIALPSTRTARAAEAYESKRGRAQPSRGLPNKPRSPTRLLFRKVGEFSGYGSHQARELAPALGRKGGKSYGGDYSTGKSAQHFSATLSMRRRGRVQIIDM